MKQTTNYQLPSWDSEDRILRTDFNTLTEKVDTALAENADAIAAETEARAAADSQITETRNCRVVTMNYSGNGQTSRTFTFTSTPMLVTVFGNGRWMFAINGSSLVIQSYLSTTSNGGSAMMQTASWSGNNVTFSSPNSDASGICNWSGYGYRLLAILEV